MKSLVVEDDFFGRLVLQRILQTVGRCDVAVNGKEAVEAFSAALKEGEPYDLACIDVMMPEMDGKEALKLIRELEKQMKVEPDKELKIIMITGIDTPKELIDSYSDGGYSAYLVKPIEKNKLFALIKDLNLVP